MGFYQPPQFGSNRPKFTGQDFSVFDISDLIGYYKMNDSGYPIIDHSGKGNDMSEGSGISFEQGSPPTNLLNSVSGDGINDFARTALDTMNEPSTTGEITIIAWVKSTGGAESNSPCISKWGTGQSFLFGLDNAGSDFWKMTVRNGGVNKVARMTAFSWRDDVWHMFCGRANGTNVLVNIDDDLQQIVGDTYTGIDSSINRPTMYRYFSGGPYLRAIISLVYIFARSLTDEEVTDMYNDRKGLLI